MAWKPGWRKIRTYAHDDALHPRRGGHVNYVQGNPLLDTALEYARHGWAVFPLQPGGKMPLLPSVHPGDTPEAREAREACKPPVCGAIGHGCWDATTDPATITAWWAAEPSANIGIATGLSDLLVLDIDTKDGKKGAETLAALLAEHGPLPVTYAARTWSGGQHYFFQMPETPLSNTTGTDKAGLGRDVDTRGFGGYVVGAPSIVRQGGKEGRYEVLTAVLPARLPEWVVQKLTKPARATWVRPGQPSAPRPTYSAPAVNTATGELFPAGPASEGPLNWLRKCAEEIACWPVGSPATQPVNDKAFLLGRLVPHCLGEDQVRDALTAAINTWEDGHEKGYKAIETGLRGGMANPRMWEEAPLPFGPELGEGQARSPATLPPPYLPDEVVEHLMPTWKAEDDTLTLRRWRGDWMRWRGTHWLNQDEEAIRAELYPLLKGAFYVTPGGKPEKWGANRARVADLMQVMQSVTYLDREVTPGAWLVGGGPDGGIIACRNGLLEVRTRTLYPHTPRYFNISSLPFDYDPEAPAPAGWLQFLESVWGDDREAIETFHEWAAYVLSGRTDLQKMMLLIGPKRSGKGTLARILTALVGKENVGGPSMGDFAKNFGLAELVDKPLAIVGDARMPSTGEKEIVSQLLSISGEDTMRADRKNRPAWVGRLPTRILILSNELPSFADSSGAIASRFIILRMTQSFLGRENKNLERSLTAELPGILNLVLDAMANLEKRGHIAEPSSSETARTIFAEQTSPIEVFLEERCTEGPGWAVEVEKIYNAWQMWCVASGRERFVGTKEGFGKKLFSARPEIRRTRPRDPVTKKQTPHYEGVTLAAAPTSVPARSEPGLSLVPDPPEPGSEWGNPQVCWGEPGETGYSEAAPTGESWM